MQITVAERTSRIPRPSPLSRPDVDALRRTIDLRLETLLGGDPGTGSLDEVLRYILLAPGKRIRPLLTVLASWELGAKGDDALDAGCALEIVHAASLVLDDLPCMDDAPWRRGQASAHVAFGQDVAILSSISLLGRAFATLSGMTHVDAGARCRLVSNLAETVGPGGLSGGQLEDLRGAALPVDGVANTNHLKTGILFVAAVDFAAIITGASKAERDRLRSFATHLGQAFQLMDDLRDSGGGAGAASEDAGKVTLVSMLGSADARTRFERHLAQALENLRPGGPLATFVREMFDEVRTPTLPARA